MSIYTKLASIQSELFVPKENNNSFGKYNYRSCEDILKTVKPLCQKYDCVLMISNDLENIGDRNYVKATVTLADLEQGDAITVTAHAREEETKKGMDGSQITGASSSYARKYALAGLFCIDNEKDSDATNMGDTPAPADVVEEAELRTKLLKYVNDKKMSKENIGIICKHYGVNSLNEMPAQACKEYLKKAEGK